MAIIQNEDGYISFSIPTDTNNPDIVLPTLNEFIDLMNGEELAYSLINRHGLITSNEVQGTFVESKPNKFRILLGHEFNPLIFRGANNDYVFMPNSQRYELADGQERIRHSIDWIKKHEFLKLISNTPYCTRAQRFKVLDYNYEVDLEAIAKHYNYMSDYLDITRNIMVAYFFAYTYLDTERNQVLPIDNFDKYSPTLYIGNLKDLKRFAPKAIENLGFQTVLRSKVQQSMSINVAEDGEKIKNLFKKIELPKNPVVARNIFAQFEGGKLLFPADYMTRCAVQIREHGTLQEEMIERYCDETKTDKDWLRGEYRKMGFELINQPWDIPEQAKYMINREIDEFIIPYLNTSFIFRGVRRESVKSELEETKREELVLNK